MAAKKTTVKKGAGRPPLAKPSEKLVAFTIAEGHRMMGFEGEQLMSGDTVMLSKEQAKFFQKKGTITMDMGAIFDEPDATTDKAETGTKSASDGAGKLNL